MKMVWMVLFVVFFASPTAAQQERLDKEMRLQTFTREVKAYARLFKLPGISVAVVQDGKILYRFNEGYADVENKIPIRDDSIFSIASITKTFTAVMMMQYEQEGKLSLDDYLLKYPLNVGWHSPRRINPNIRLKHVLSMTSGGVPGRTYSYHGGRYNFLSGVFDQISGRESPASYVEEVKSRILEPLHLTSTRAGYPDKPDSLTSRIVKRYQIAPGKAGSIYTNVPYDWNAAYPASGLLSSIDDLATYAGALDDTRLIPRERYEKITVPFVNDKGRQMPYGYGWVTQRFEGIALHWVYGYGDADSALFLRVPDRKLTFIFLSNCAFPSQACRLGNGNVLRSPFALSFLKHFVLTEEVNKKVIDYESDIARIRQAFLQPTGQKLPSLVYEELYTQALIRAFTRDIFPAKTRQPEQLIQLLSQVYPAAFTRPDPTLIYLMSLLDDATFRQTAERLIRSYHPARDFCPELPYWIGKYYEKRGKVEKAMQFYQSLADMPGFEDENNAIEACALLGRYFLKKGQIEKGREYLWKSILYAQEAHYSGDFITERYIDLNRPQQEWITGKLSTPEPPALRATIHVSPAIASHGNPVMITITTRNTGGTLYGGIVDVEIKDASGSLVNQQFRTDQVFFSGQARTYLFTWTPMIAGRYTVDLGFFGSNWTRGYRFDKGVATITVN